MILSVLSRFEGISVADFKTIFSPLGEKKI